MPTVSDKTPAAFDFALVPTASRAQVHALAAGDAWIDKGAGTWSPNENARLSAGVLFRDDDCAYAAAFRRVNQMPAIAAPKSRSAFGSGTWVVLLPYNARSLT